MSTSRGSASWHDHTVVGGKAANLSRLAASYRVPPGFCLPAPAFDRARTDDSEPSALSPAHRNELAVAYEEMGFPVDVECAYEDGRLYLLQSRPVTALDGLRYISTNPLTGEENDNDDHGRTS